MLAPGNESYGARPGSISQNNGMMMNGIPMSTSNRLRRESMVGGDLAKSLMSGGGGMSWGGVSVGSWIRDECVCSLRSKCPLVHAQSTL